MLRSSVVSVVVACLALTGCKKEAAKSRAKQAAEATDFWPEAPMPTSKTGTKTFRYNAPNVGAYTILAEGGTTQKSLPLKFDMRLDVDFRAGEKPNERNAHMKLLTLSMDAAGKELKMRVDDQQFYFKEGAEETTLKRGEPAPFDVAELTEKPITVVTFGEDNTVKLRAHPDHPFETFGGGAGDMLDSALLLFPDLPTGAIAPGHKWKVTRNTPVGATEARVDVSYDFEYVGDGACPTGKTTCSLFAFTASTPGVDAVTDEGRKVHAAYGFAGKVFFDYEKGVVDESRVRADIDAKTEGISLEIGATYIIKPVR